MVRVSDLECENLEKVGTCTILKILKASTREKREEGRWECVAVTVREATEVMSKVAEAR